MNGASIYIRLAVIILGLTGCTSAQTTSSLNPMFKLDSTLFPYESHYLKLKTGASVHYVDEGSGPVLLLLHGNPTWSFLYRHLITELKDEFRLIAPDYPGFGLSSAPQDYAFTAAEHAAAITEFVEQLDLQDATLMVQDWGGPIGLSVAEKLPDRITAFIIGNTWAWPLERFGHKVFSTLMGGWPGRFASWCCNGVVRFFMARGMEADLTEAEMAMYLAPFDDRKSRTPTHIFPAQLRGASQFLQEVSDALPTLSERPALIVWGIKDFAFQEPERSRLENVFPNHQTILLEQASHFIQEDAPVEIAEAIRKWYPIMHNQ